MSLIIYSNGIMEEMSAIDNTFNDNELIDSFTGYDDIMSQRLSEVPNTWCLWGEMEEPLDSEYNKLASEIVEYDVYSHMIFIHDSELNPNWGVTDTILYRVYTGWLEMIGNFINDMTQQIVRENRKEIEESESEPASIFLSTLGQTDDKRVLFGFNPTEQNTGFYKNGGWSIFSEKIYDYLKEYFDKEDTQENKPFVIYSDTKTIVIIEDKYVDEVISNMITHFKSQEKYEECSFISKTKERWYKLKEEIDVDASIGRNKKK